MSVHEWVCPDGEECLGGLLAGPADEGERLRYQSHLDACATCEQEWRKLRKLAELLRRTYADDVRERFDEI